MPLSRSVLSILLSTLISVSLFAQQTSTRASAMLQQALLTLSPSVSISDVTLSGSARRIAGSDDETGTVTLEAMAGGAARMDANFSSGQRGEIQNLLNGPPTGAWSGPDSVSHPIAHHNLMTDPSWFFPALVISRVISTSSYATAYVGHESRHEQAVQHVQVWQASSLHTPASVS